MPNSEDVKKISAFFSAFADETRIRIISALSLSKMCVGDLCVTLDINQTTLSHQLSLLKRLQVVDDERQGKSVFYKIKDGKILSILAFGVQLID